MFIFYKRMGLLLIVMNDSFFILVPYGVQFFFVYYLYLACRKYVVILFLLKCKQKN